MTDIALGFCDCGCGTVTNIAKKTSSRNGHLKGHPVRFVTGHWMRTKSPGHTVDVETGCWNWNGKLKADGYPFGGSRSTNGVLTRPAIYTVYYQAVNGPVPAGLHIDHLCRNRRCVNPDHLEAVTPRENNRRRLNCLTPADVREIRALCNGGIRQSQVARKFNVDQSAICHIMRGRSWGDLI